MTKKISWRLGKLPSVDELATLVHDKIITQDEAREILFTKEESTERDKKSLEEEIKFLRQLVEQLSKNNHKIIYETIKIIEPTYKQYPWYQPYNSWVYLSSGTNGVYQRGSTITNLSSGNSLVGIGTCSSITNSTGDFTSIKTF